MRINLPSRNEVKFNQVPNDPPLVSVIICVYNQEKYLEKCIDSLLNQSFQNFEIIVVDDCSKSGVYQVIQKKNDKRIRYFRNEKRIGIAGSRNIGLKHAKAKYIFFTDADCIVSKNWLNQGLGFLEIDEIAGVEGMIFYVSETYTPTFSDNFTENKSGNQFMTGNMAYKKDVVMNLGGFDERYTYFEDRDLGLRVLAQGKKIVFNKGMVVYVQKQTMTPNELLERKKNILKNRVYLFKRFKERKGLLWRILDPLSLAKLIFPPLTFSSLFFNKFKTMEDFKLLPFIYFACLLERIELWKTCAKERVFLI